MAVPGRRIRLTIWGRYWVWKRDGSHAVLVDRGEAWEVDNDDRRWWPLFALEVNK